MNRPARHNFAGTRFLVLALLLGGATAHAAPERRSRGDGKDPGFVERGIRAFRERAKRLRTDFSSRRLKGMIQHRLDRSRGLARERTDAVHLLHAKRVRGELDALRNVLKKASKGTYSQAKLQHAIDRVTIAANSGEQRLATMRLARMELARHLRTIDASRDQTAAAIAEEIRSGLLRLDRGIELARKERPLHEGTERAAEHVGPEGAEPPDAAKPLTEIRSTTDLLKALGGSADHGKGPRVATIRRKPGRAAGEQSPAVGIDPAAEHAHAPKPSTAKAPTEAPARVNRPAAKNADPVLAGRVRGMMAILTHYRELTAERAEQWLQKAVTAFTHIGEDAANPNASALEKRAMQLLYVAKIQEAYNLLVYNAHTWSQELRELFSKVITMAAPPAAEAQG